MKLTNFKSNATSSPSQLIMRSFPQQCTECLSQNTVALTLFCGHELCSGCADIQINNCRQNQQGEQNYLMIDCNFCESITQIKDLSDLYQNISNMTPIQQTSFSSPKKYNENSLSDISQRSHNSTDVVSGYSQHNLHQLTPKEQQRQLVQNGKGSPCESKQRHQRTATRDNFEKENTIFQTLKAQILEANICNEHGEEITFFCMAEKKLCCLTCVYNSQGHKKRNVMPIKQSIQILRDENQTFQTTCKDKTFDIEESLINCQNNKIKLNQSISNYTSYIESEFSKVQKLLQQRLEQSLEQIQKFYEQANKECSDKHESLQFLKNCMKEYSDLERSPESIYQETIVYLFSISNMLKNAMKNFQIKTPVRKWESLDLIDINNIPLISTEIKLLGRSKQKQQQISNLQNIQVASGSILSQTAKQASKTSTRSKSPLTSQTRLHHQHASTGRSLIPLTPTRISTQNQEQKDNLCRKSFPLKSTNAGGSSPFSGRKTSMNNQFASKNQNELNATQFVSQKQIRSPKQQEVLSEITQQIEQNILPYFSGVSSNRALKTNYTSTASTPIYDQSRDSSLPSVRTPQGNFFKSELPSEQSFRKGNQQQYQQPLSQELIDHQMQFQSNFANIENDKKQAEYTSESQKRFKNQQQSPFQQNSLSLPQSDRNSDHINSEKHQQKQQQQQLAQINPIANQEGNSQALKNSQSKLRSRQNSSSFIKNSNTECLFVSNSSASCATGLLLPTDQTQPQQQLLLLAKGSSTLQNANDTTCNICQTSESDCSCNQKTFSKGKEEDLKSNRNANEENRMSPKNQSKLIVDEQSEKKKKQIEALKLYETLFQRNVTQYVEVHQSNLITQLTPQNAPPISLSPLNYQKQRQDELLQQFNISPNSTPRKNNQFNHHIEEISPLDQFEESSPQTEEGIGLIQSEVFPKQYNSNSGEKLPSFRPSVNNQYEENDLQNEPNSRIHQESFCRFEVSCSASCQKGDDKNSNTLDQCRSQLTFAPGLDNSFSVASLPRSPNTQQGVANNFILPEVETQYKQTFKAVSHFTLSQSINKIYQGTMHAESIILFKSLQIDQKCLQVLPEGIKSIKLLYRLSQDGASSQTFHQKCDSKGPSMTLVQANGDHMFGYYMPLEFKRDDQYSTSDKCFIFTLVNSIGIQPQRFHVRSEKKFISIYQNSKNPCLGSTLNQKQDLLINFDCLEKSCSNLGYAYKIDQNIPGDKVLAGKYTDWSISEIEVFSLEF